MSAMTHRTWILFSGCLWLLMGLWLLSKGLRLIPDSFGLIALGLMIGFFKGRFVLSKTVQRVVNHILAQPLPVRFKDAYGKAYWLVIGFMMSLGMVLRFIPNDVRGVIDVAVGFALINGAMLYFTYGIQSPSQSQGPGKSAR
jgi:hypothetical protein